MPPRLLALDMDGTLLRDDKTVDPRDRAAIVRALDAGVIVTIATGRIATGALPTARALGLTAPLVCAEGGVVACSRTGARLAQQGIAIEVVAALVAAFGAHEVTPFVLTHDAVHCDEAGRSHAGWVSIWTEEIRVYPRLAEARGWMRDGEVAFAFGVGSRARVEAVTAVINRDHDAHVEGVTVPVGPDGDRWALLLRPRGCSKGVALARLAAEFGVAREDAAVVGDYYNDLPMFQWAGRSFAMGQAPDDVRAAATDVLVATSRHGGGVAEAIARWLGPGPA